MAEKNAAWLDWGKRFRVHVRERGIRWGDLASRVGQAESTLRSWINGTRKINLADFFELCGAADADAAMILFGRLPLTDEMKRRLGTAIVSVLESDTSVNPDYGPYISAVRKDRKKRDGK